MEQNLGLKYDTIYYSAKSIACYSVHAINFIQLTFKILINSNGRYVGGNYRPTEWASFNLMKVVLRSLEWYVIHEILSYQVSLNLV